ncbi:MAG: flagellar biosynthesis protein FliQ [Clostridium sp.]|nr:flagellar biosynthesis protein FliQ [Clostridium sp.]MCM1547558.1 flagellar biosynthesis protein FliQ [Ruminococcus sp.]
MDQGEVLQIFRSAMYVAVKLAAPLLIVSILIGLVIAIFQAATQIHEQTLTFVPKVLVLGLMLLVLGSWMMTTISEFFNQIFDLIAGI